MDQHARLQTAAPETLSKWLNDLEDESLVGAIRHELDELPFDVARALASELRRRGAGLGGATAKAPATDSGELSDALALVNARLAHLERERQLSRLRSTVEGEISGAEVDTFAQEPARRRLLGALRVAPDTPTSLASKLGLAPATVSRLLQGLSDSGLVNSVSDPDDRRRKIYSYSGDGVYSLTSPGFADLARSEALLGAAEPPQSGTESREDYLNAAVVDTIALRRHANALPDATARFEAIVQQAHADELSDLELLARKELATTLRQAGQFDSAREQISEMEAMIERVEPDLVLPVHAHCRYEEGRLPSSTGAELIERARHLNTAAECYESVRLRPPGRSIGGENWLNRSAWSIASLAENLREQTEFGQAIDQANKALGLFRETEDDYGRARCAFLLGFCHRLRGQFNRAETYLRDALQIAQANNYRRWTADTITQIGDVMRCRGEYAMAEGMLIDAIALSEGLQMRVTKGFAESALGATLCSRENPDLDSALTHLEAAQRCFEDASHREGTALNLRRLGVLYRVRDEVDRSSPLFVDALLRYQADSPAGTAACLIGLGKNAHGMGEDSSRVAGLIVGLLKTPSFLRMVQLDPWLPSLVDQFANETSHDELSTVSSLLVKSAYARLAEDDSSAWPIAEPKVPDTHRVADLIAALEESLTTPDARDDIAPSPPDEMAGEPRRDMGRLAAAA